jgi:two-component system sensor kinase FixL
MGSTTANKQTLKAFEAARTSFFTMSLDLLCIAGLDGYFKRVNPAWQTTFGFTPEELVSRPFVEFIHPDDIEPTNARYASLTEQGKDVIEFENRYRCKDGSYRWLLWNARTAPDEQLIYAIARDVTERKQAEEALKESEERKRVILDTAVDCIITINEKGIVESVNPAGERMFGYAAEEVLGRNVSMLMPTPYREEHDGYLANYVRTGEKRIIDIGREVSGRRKDGTTFPIDLAVSEAQRGQRREFVGIVRDITKRKRAEEDLARHADALTRSNEELEDFTHVVSHDLKEPLRGIEAFSGFLIEEYGDKLDETGRHYLDVLTHSASRLRDLIDDLLQLSRLGRAALHRVPVEVDSLMRELRDSLAFTLTDNRVDLRVQEDMPTIFCDPVRIQSVFQNLVSNAIKYNDKPEGARIEITCEERDSDCLFCVLDNGPGIAPQYHKKIFRIFQRLVRRDEQEGTGVGLALCKKIIETRGGTIWVESDGNGNGSAFFFTIPAVVPENADQEATE